MQQINIDNISFHKPIGRANEKALWILFITYVVAVAVAMLHHELWADELHSWNIAKGSTGYLNLIHNRRYEGHPPAWYTVLWIISKFTHNLVYMQIAQLLFIIFAVYVFIFHSPFPLFIKALIPFGYYFLFEFAVFSRNYAIGILPCFVICTIIRKDFRYKMLLYYVSLFWMSNTHLLAEILAASIHLYFLQLLVEQKKRKSFIIQHIVVAILILLPSLYFVASPSDGEMNSSFWFNRWHIGQLAVVAQMPLRSFVPLPAWWESNFWNTQFLLDLYTRYKVLKIICPVLSVIVVACIFFILSKSRKACVLFGVNLFLSAAICCIFSLSTTRYVGYIFIGFIVACWFHYFDSPISLNRIKLMAVFLFVHVIAGMYAFAEDFRRPFSKLSLIGSLVNEVPAKQRVVTDYWALNAISAYINQPFYCVDLRQNASFILWGSDMKRLNEDTCRYASGVKILFASEKINQTYMISTGSPIDIENADKLLFKDYSVQLIDERTGAIEKGSNIYLYRISKQ